MLENTFCHISGIGLKTEREMWAEGALSWTHILDGVPLNGKSRNRSHLRRCVRESVEQLDYRNSRYFAKTLPAAESWRLFREFRDSTAYLDIETTGTGEFSDYITSIALYDGHEVRYYVYGCNLETFVDDIMDYRVIVTYNGKCFDIPFINRFFDVRLPHAHIDLRFVLHSLGLRGGLKGCERQLGLNRNELAGVDGYFAVLLWHDYITYENDKALETLLAYNILDAVNLEPLMVIAYNRKLAGTPFEETHPISMPLAPVNPFEPDIETIERIRAEYF